MVAPKAVRATLKIPNEEYAQFGKKHFLPSPDFAKNLVKSAKDAGIRYIVLTSKHHDGFCLFKSDYTDYSSYEYFGRDICRELADECKKEGLGLGLYYSHTLDWHEKDAGGNFHSAAWLPVKNRNDWDFPDENFDFEKYLYEKCFPQVRELLTNYGKIDILWFDFSYDAGVDLPDYQPWMKGKGKEEWESEELIALARSLQPDIIIDNRADIEQDIWTPEQNTPKEWLKHPETGELVTWEACQTFSGSWGYYRDETSWKSPEMLLQMLIKTVSLGGNLLMNVGPTSRGYFDDRAEKALKVYADWMKYNSRSIYGCTMAEPEFTAPGGCCLTQSEDGKRLYVHLFQYPFAYLELPGFAGKVDYAQFLHDGSELKFSEREVKHFSEGRTEAEDLLVIELPVPGPRQIVPVIELFLK